MRLVLITVSAIALSGCTWFGGGSQSGSHGFNGQSAVNCAPQGGYANGYNFQGYQGQSGFQGAGCGPAGGYSVAGGQYGQQGGAYGGQVGATGYGLTGIAQAGAGYPQGAAYTAGYAQGYGAQTGVSGLRGSYGAGGYGVNGYGGVGGQQATTLGASAPFGAAVGGQFAGQQFAGQQFGGANVQTVQGAPIYVNQPYPVYGGAAGCAGGFNGPGCGVNGVAQPFGLEFGIGTDFGISGDISPLRDETTSNGFGLATNADGTIDPAQTRVVSETQAISYNDAFNEAVQYDVAGTYDVGPNTTLLGRFGYSEANGQAVDVGTAFEFAAPPVDPANIVVPAGAESPVTANFSDLEQFTLEAGVRQYIGGFHNGVTGIRPYVGATAGAIRNNDVNVTLSSPAFVSTAGTDAPIAFIDGGWNPTASGVVGAEWQVGSSIAVGAEAGIRWQDNLHGLTAEADDRFSVPVRLRGRVSF